MLNATLIALLTFPVFFAGGSQDLAPIPEHPAIAAAVKAMTSATAGRKPLPLPAFNLCFPILQAVLGWPEISPLHDSALAILGLHVKPGLAVPREAMLTLLYLVLGTIPAYRYSFPHPMQLCTLEEFIFSILHLQSLLHLSRL